MSYPARAEGLVNSTNTPRNPVYNGEWLIDLELIYIYNLIMKVGIWFGWVYDISVHVDYLTPNLVYTYISNIIKVFWTIVFIFIVFFTTFRPIYPPAFFKCLSNSGNYTELRTTSFIEYSGIACSDFINHYQVQVLRIPVLLLACSQDWTCNLQMIVSLEA